MAALGALPGLLGGQSAQYGMKVKKMEEGGESDPPKADFLLRGSAEEVEEGPTMIGGTEILGGNPLMGDLMATRLASETTQAGAGLSPIGYGELYSDEGTESSERSPQESTMPIPPLRPKDPGPLPIDINPKLLKRDYPKTPQEDQEFDMEFVFDQTPLPKGERDVRYQRYQKTMGVKDPKTGKYYFLDSASGFKGPKGPRNLSISSLPEDQRARVMKAIEDQEMKFAGESDFYRRQRGL